MLLGAGAVATKTYVDDVFSTYLYAGNGADQTITNGINLTGEGGLTWLKNRTKNAGHALIDTVRGAGQYVRSDITNGEAGTGANNNFNSFTSTGFTLKNDSGSDLFNNENSVYASWSFRKAKGFCDVVEFSGNGVSGRTISHSLGSVPGMMLLKRTDRSGDDWYVYHKSIGATKHLHLNETAAVTTQTSIWNDTAPTSSVFSVGNDASTNASGGTYICYVFAGGESTTDKAVDFDGSGDYLSIPDSTAWDIGTNYTAECFFNIDALTGVGWDAIFGQWPNNNNDSANTWTLEYVGTDLRFYYNDASTTVQYKSLGTVSLTEWHHFAFSKDGSTTRLFVDGDLKHSFTISLNAGNGSFNIGGNVAGGGYINGKVSNVRVTKDQALYTNTFNVLHDPLTTTSQGAVATNVKLLCCNGSTTTSSTVTPGTITANGDTAVTTNNSIFDDTAANKFGDAEESIIKCGSYVGTSSDIHVYTGGESQWVMVKNTSRAETDWYIIDVMRGAPAVGAENCKLLLANTTAAEGDLSQLILPTATGFTARTGAGYAVNYNGDSYVYIAIRRPDGYVGKPPELGTDVFDMDLAGQNTARPTWQSSMSVVDMGIIRTIAGAHSWMTTARLIQGTRVKTDTTDAAGSYSLYAFDYNGGWGDYGGTSYMSWMWKRHAGFDVVCYTGNSPGYGTNPMQIIPHSMNKVPEMILIKSRSNAQPWAVYHSSQGAGKYFDGIGTGAISTGDTRFGGVEPTSTHFNLGTSGDVNYENYTYIAMLFASVDGISKVGTYSGNDSNQTITFGFSPRFVIIKSTSANTGWVVLDTVRGWTDSDSREIRLDRTNAQDSSDSGIGYATSTGMVLTGGGSGHTNSTPYVYIYYAHA